MYEPLVEGSVFCYLILSRKLRGGNGGIGEVE